MERENMLELQPDKLFEKYSLSEISRIRFYNLVEEIRKIKTKLREIIGENYEEFIAATGKTDELRNMIFQIVEDVQSIRTAYNSLENLQLLDVPKSCNDQHSHAENTEHTTAAVLIKLLIDVTEQIWCCIDEKDLITATLLLQLNGHVKTVLEMDLSNRLKESLPVLYDQWSSILRFPFILSETVNKHLLATNLTPQVCSECLCCLTLLEQLSAEKILQRFLSIRSDSLETAFKNTDGMKQTVKYHISESLRVIYGTFRAIYYCFIESAFGKEGMFQEELQKIIGKQTPPVLNLVKFDYTFSYTKQYIPVTVHDYRITLSDDIVQPIKSIKVCQETAEWFSSVQAFVSNEAAPLFNVICTLEALKSVKDSCKDITEDWNVITNSLRLPLNFNLWKELYEPLMIARAKELLFDYWNIIYETVKKDIGYMMHSVNTNKSDKSEMDLHWFLWDMELDTKAEMPINDLLIKTEGLSPNAAAVAEVIEKHSGTSFRDLQNLCFDGQSENEEMHLLLLKHQQECSYKFVIRIVDYIHDASCNDVLLEASCIFLARLLLAIIMLTPSLKQCLQADNENFTKWSEIIHLLEKESEHLWKKWISLIIAEITSDITNDLQNCQDIFYQINIMPKWVSLNVEEENENGEKISSTIKVPAHASFSLQAYLNKLNSKCGCVLPPRSIINDLVSQSIVNILQYYNQCCQYKCPQPLYIQFMFDVMYIISLLVPVENKKLLLECQKTVSKLEEIIDPFDLDAISIHMMQYVKSFTFRTKALYGIIATSKAHSSATTGSNIAPTEDPNVAYTGAQNVPWFPLLPIVHS